MDHFRLSFNKLSFLKLRCSSSKHMETGFILHEKDMTGGANILLFHHSSPGVIHLGEWLTAPKFFMVWSFVVNSMSHSSGCHQTTKYGMV